MVFSVCISFELLPCVNIKPGKYCSDEYKLTGRKQICHDPMWLPLENNKALFRGVLGEVFLDFFYEPH